MSSLENDHPKRFEAGGNMADWPPNVPGKRTRAVVLGLYHPKRGRTREILWSGEFPDLEPAMYWAAKKELEAVRKQKWNVATRILWQHDLTVEQAVQAAVDATKEQFEVALDQFKNDSYGDLGPGPMKMIDLNDVKDYYIEVERTDGPNGPG